MDSALQDIDAQRGLTPREVARRYRVSPDRVRAWILRGELGALNLGTNRCGRPRYVVLPEHLGEFERARKVAATPPVKRRKRLAAAVDYYPD